MVDTNLVGTLNVLESAREWGSKLMFLSTSRVYPIEKLRAIRLTESDTRFGIAAAPEMSGVTANGVSEEFPLEGARMLYGATKYASEIMVREYAAQFGLQAVANRCGFVAGPWQMGRADQGVLTPWVAHHYFGLPLTYIVYGGKQVRDALHIEDLCDLVLMQIAASGDWRGQVYNVGGGCSSSFSLLD